MKVVTFETTDGKERYLLVDTGGVPIEEARLFLRFEDNRGLARNTLKQKCIHLKHFYTFLQQKRIKYKDVTVDDLASYIAWLKYPNISEKVIPLNMEPRFREQCINANVDTVIGFYNYLLLHDDLENTLSEKLVKFVRTPGKGYRSFLYGIVDNKAQVQAQVGGETSYAKRVAGLVKHRYSAILSSGSIPMSYLSTPKPRKWGRIHKTEEKGNNTIIWYCKNIYCTNSCIFFDKISKNDMREFEFVSTSCN